MSNAWRITQEIAFHRLVRHTIREEELYKLVGNKCYVSIYIKLEISFTNSELGAVIAFCSRRSRCPTSRWPGKSRQGRWVEGLQVSEVSSCRRSAHPLMPLGFKALQMGGLDPPQISHALFNQCHSGANTH